MAEDLLLDAQGLSREDIDELRDWLNQRGS